MLVIVPSRGRPKSILELIESWNSTRFAADLLICVDDDDPEIDAYRAIQRPPWAMMVVAPRMRLGPTLNHWATKMMHDYTYIGFMGDDHRPRTAGWDKRFREDLPQIGVAYGNDLIQGAALPTQVMLTSNIVKALGRMVPEGMIHMYLDNYWLDLGNALNARVYLPDVIIEHMHPVAGKAEWDDRYHDSNQSWGDDEKRYHEFVNAGGIAKDAAVVVSYVGMYGE